MRAFQLVLLVSVLLLAVSAAIWQPANIGALAMSAVIILFFTFI